MGTVCKRVVVVVVVFENDIQINLAKGPEFWTDVFAKSQYVFICFSENKYRFGTLIILE